jgi:indole-3-glycerol phosphate synthase
VLVIARIVSEESLRALVAEALAAGLEPLVEVTSVGELQAALATQARLIGVNARDLDTLTMDSERAAAVVGAIPPDRIALHLSGIKAQQDVLTVAQGRADGALIGEILMRQEDPGPLLREWSKALQRASSASQPLAPPRP